MTLRQWDPATIKMAPLTPMGIPLQVELSVHHWDPVTVSLATPSPLMSQEKSITLIQRATPLSGPPRGESCLPTQAPRKLCISELPEKKLIKYGSNLDIVLLFLIILSVFTVMLFKWFLIVWCVSAWMLLLRQRTSRSSPECVLLCDWLVNLTGTCAAQYFHLCCGSLLQKAHFNKNTLRCKNCLMWDECVYAVNRQK